MPSGIPNSSPQKPCEWCSAMFKYKLSEEKRGHARFCGVVCQREWQSKTRVGKVHSYWKGDKVGYMALHSWVRRQLGTPNKCEECGTDGLTCHSIHWANISRKYKRDISDWARLCVKCHKRYDLNKIKYNLQEVK